MGMGYWDETGFRWIEDLDDPKNRAEVEKCYEWWSTPAFTLEPRKWYEPEVAAQFFTVRKTDEVTSEDKEFLFACGIKIFENNP